MVYFRRWVVQDRKAAKEGGQSSIRREKGKSRVVRGTVVAVHRRTWGPVYKTRKPEKPCVEYDKNCSEEVGQFADTLETDTTSRGETIQRKSKWLRQFRSVRTGRGQLPHHRAALQISGDVLRDGTFFPCKGSRTVKFH